MPTSGYQPRNTPAERRAFFEQLRLLDGLAKRLGDIGGEGDFSVATWVQFLFGESLWHRHGAGDPEGVVAAPIGTLWTREDGGAGTTLYVKESGAAGNTGWVAK